MTARLAKGRLGLVGEDPDLLAQHVLSDRGLHLGVFKSLRVELAALGAHRDRPQGDALALFGSDPIDDDHVALAHLVLLPADAHDGVDDLILSHSCSLTKTAAHSSQSTRECQRARTPVRPQLNVHRGGRRPPPHRPRPLTRVACAPVRMAVTTRTRRRVPRNCRPPSMMTMYPST